MNGIRGLVVLLTTCCVLAGVVPAVLVLADVGWSEWLNVSEFHQNLSDD